MSKQGGKAEIAICPGGGLVMMILYGDAYLEDRDGDVLPGVVMRASGVRALIDKLQISLERIDDPEEDDELDND